MARVGEWGSVVLLAAWGVVGCAGDTRPGAGHGFDPSQAQTTGGETTSTTSVTSTSSFTSTPSTSSTPTEPWTGTWTTAPWSGVCDNDNDPGEVGPIPVTLAETGDGWQLLRGGQPYTIKGAGGGYLFEPSTYTIEGPFEL